jgi:uncharacterized protein YfaS (alpha-2-macroglobulin family)
VHKGEFYIGVAPGGYVLQVGEKGQVNVLTVDPQSKPVPRTRVELVVSAVEWLSVREQLEDGQYYWVTRPKKTGVVTETVTTDANGEAVLEWTPSAPGEYKVDASARDAQGNHIRSGAYIWVGGEEYVAWRQRTTTALTWSWTGPVTVSELRSAISPPAVKARHSQRGRHQQWSI